MRIVKYGMSVVPEESIGFVNVRIKEDSRKIQIAITNRWSELDINCDELTEESIKMLYCYFYCWLGNYYQRQNNIFDFDKHIEKLKRKI